MRRPCAMHSRKRNCSGGFTLVELLVTMFVGAVLTTGVVAVFIQQSRAMALNEDFVDLEQNLRIAIGMIHRDIRMAGAYSKDELQPFTIGLIDNVDIDRDGDVDINDQVNSEGIGSSPDVVQIVYSDQAGLNVKKYKGSSNHLWMCGPSGFNLGQILTISRNLVDKDTHLTGVDRIIEERTINDIDTDSSCPDFTCPNKCEKIKFIQSSPGVDGKYEGGSIWPSLWRITYFLTSDANLDAKNDDPALMRTNSFDVPAIVAFGIKDMQIVYILDNGTEITEITVTDPKLRKEIYLSIQRVRIFVSGETRNAHAIGGPSTKRTRTMTTEVQVRNLFY